MPPRTTTIDTPTAAQILSNLSTIPFSPSGQLARGIIAPIMRAAGHLLYLRADLANEAGSFAHMTPEEQKNEVQHAKEHLAGANLPADLDTLSVTAKGHIGVFVANVGYIYDGWDGFNADDRANLVSSAAHRAAALGCFLDRELTGINTTATDPGSSF
jgi:hypothetical protein